MTSTYLSRHPMTASRDLGGETIIIRARDSRLFTLNELGGAVWHAADGRTSLDAIVQRVCDAYDIDPATARADLLAFVHELEAEGVLLTSDAPQAEREGHQP